MTSRLIYRLLAKWYNDLPVCVFALNVKTVLVLNEGYSNILCYLNSFHFFSLLLASVLAPNVKQFTKNDLDCLSIKKINSFQIKVQLCLAFNIKTLFGWELQGPESRRAEADLDYIVATKL